MTTVITFCRQNEAISRACTTKYCGNLILVVVLVLESKDLCFFFSSFELKPSELESLSGGEMLTVRAIQMKLSSSTFTRGCYLYVRTVLLEEPFK